MTDCHRVALRIGPVVLAAEGPASLLRLAPPQDRQTATGDVIPRPLVDFALGAAAAASLAPDLLLVREPGPPEPRPAGEPAYRHRAGWDLYAQPPSAWLAVKAVPYGSGRVLRSVRIALGHGRALLRVAPEDDRPERPFAYTLTELLCLLLTERAGALLVHAAGVARGDGTALLLPGASGSGKSTLAALWARHGPGPVLGDESLLLWIDARSGVPCVSGTPWPGSSGLWHNAVAPLGALRFLEHGSVNALHALSPADAMARLLAQCFLPQCDPAAMRAAAGVAAAVAERVTAARLAFVPGESAVRFLDGGGEGVR